MSDSPRQAARGEDAAVPRPGSRLRRAAVAVVAAAAVGVVAASVLGRFGAASWWLDLLSHFRLQYSGLLAVALVALGVLRARLPAALVAVALAVELVALAPLVGGGPDDVDGPTLRVVSVNVNTANRERAAVGAWLADQHADVVVVQETDAAWAAVLDERLDGLERLPTDTLRADNFGIGVWLRDGLSVGEVAVVETAADVPAITAVVDLGGRSTLLYALHTLPPLDAPSAAASRRQLDDARDVVATHDGPAMLVGDLNATRWSALLRPLLADPRLHDSARGFGVAGTWPTGLGMTGRIGIDHVLVTPEIGVLDHRRGPDLGSDHLPVVVDVGLRLTG